jgi:hypothetical protein
MVLSFGPKYKGFVFIDEKWNFSSAGKKEGNIKKVSRIQEKSKFTLNLSIP